VLIAERVISVARVLSKTSRLSVFALTRSWVASAFRVERVASVEAPVGNGKDEALIGTVPETATVQTPLWVAATAKELWLLAMTTGVDAAIAAWPKDGTFAFIADSVASVEAPDGNGREAALIGTVPLIPTVHTPL